MLDLLLEAWTSFLIEVAKSRGEAGNNGTWRPGRKLKLLIAAYNGARNTGEDVRVEEIVRQLRWILGEENVDLSVLTFDEDLSRGYFGDAKQIYFPNIFPPFLYREVPRHDGAMACLGATFSKTFAKATAAYMIGALGMASSKRRIAVAYGAEAGYLDGDMAAMCRRYCGKSLLIMRNEESRAVLSELGLPSELGADTAWTFEPHPPEYGRRALRQAGWDEKKRVLVICPNNPFWWPVKASVLKYLARTLRVHTRTANIGRSIFIRQEQKQRQASTGISLPSQMRSRPTAAATASFRFSWVWNSWTVMRVRQAPGSWEGCRSSLRRSTTCINS